MIFDTNALSAWLGGNPEIRVLLAEYVQPRLPVVVIGEYFFGLMRSTRRNLLTQALEKLLTDSMILPIGLETARCYAEVREELRQQGRPIPANDLWIAALAIQHRLPVLSRDTHFDGITGLTRKFW